MSFNNQNNVLPVLGQGIATLLLCFSCFVFCAQAEEKLTKIFFSQARSVERKLQTYLKKRVLVFRNGEIGSHQVKFDSGGRPLEEGGVEWKSNSKAMLFIDLWIGAEQLVIVGEAVEIRPGVAGRIYVRNPRKFSLVTCTVIHNVPADELTFLTAIGLLCQIFLTREELEKVSLN